MGEQHALAHAPGAYEHQSGGDLPVEGGPLDGFVGSGEHIVPAGEH
jgi:hypothetical protein